MRTPLQKTGDDTMNVSEISRSPLTTRHSPLSLVESALTDELRVSPGFGRTTPLATPLDSALTDTLSVTPLESALTKNGERGPLRQLSIRRRLSCRQPLAWRANRDQEVGRLD